LLRTDEPQSRRCFAVLDGCVPPGKIFVDNPADPQWAIVQEVIDHSLYLGGRIDAATFADVFAALRQEGNVLIGMWPEDPRISLLPPDPVYDGRTLEFYDRPIGAGLDRFLRHVPDDCEIRRLDRDQILRTEWGPGDVELVGGLDVWEKTHINFGLMRGDEILSDAGVGQPAIGLYEPGVFTRPEHRGKGCGTLVVARLIQEIEAMGGRTYWNCAKQNLASAAIARKLGYQIEKEYRCMVWSKTE